jgi:hypothetical protein
MAAYEALDALVDRLAGATWKEREPIKKEIQDLAASFPDRKSVLEHLASKKKDIADLEARWEIDEVIEALTPPPPTPEPAKDEKKPGPEKQLSAADLVLVYDDPRGLLLHRTKAPPDRWFATQRNPQTGQPQTFELRGEEVTQLKTQLTGSPYWVIGAAAS